jgi:hypothetical protein
MSKTKEGSTSEKEGNLENEISLFFRSRATPLRKVWRSIEEDNARCVFVPQKPLVSPCGALFILRMNLDRKSLWPNQV